MLICKQSFSRCPLQVIIEPSIGAAVNATISEDHTRSIFYRSAYCPQTTGTHCISITLDGKHLAGSPFIVDVKEGEVPRAAFAASQGMLDNRSNHGQSVGVVIVVVDPRACAFRSW